MANAHPYTYTYSLPTEWRPNTAACGLSCATPLSISVESFTPLMPSGTQATYELDAAQTMMYIKAYTNQNAGTYSVKLTYVCALH